MQKQPEETDWKRFRAIVPELRERYLRTKNVELVAIFQNESLTPTEQFWAVSERIDEIGSILRTCLDGHKRSRMMEFLMFMCRYKMITDDDLDGFTEEVRKRINEY